MEFDEIVVKENPGLCRCCLSEGCYKDLSTEYAWMDETEVYADMLLECFDISISQHVEGPNGVKRLICEVCITRLRDACNFKKQVLDSEKKFVDMVGRGEFMHKVVVYQSMKAENEQEQETEMQEEGEVEFLDEDMTFDDDTILEQHLTAPEPSVSEDITVSTLKVKKRGRPRKSDVTVKLEKKAKVPRLEEKPRTSKAVAKGPKQPESDAKSMSSTKLNRLVKRNAITILESSTVMPFKWQRQNYLCFFCHETFKDTQLLKEHTRKEHDKSNIRAAVSYLRMDEQVKIDVSVILCKNCDMKFDKIDSLITHIKITHKKIFNDEFGYGIIPYKLDNERFQCAVCEQEFQYFIKLNQHMNSHFSNYVCHSCGKSFLSRHRLRSHNLSHGSGFRCNICSESFDSLKKRNNHETKIHNINKQMKCFYCTETFETYNKRKKHHNIAHNMQMPKYNCPVCNKTFYVMSRMQVHHREVHLQEKNFSCSMCEQKFFSTTRLQKHMVKHCGDRVHECEVCKKTYARKQTLRDHMRIHSDDKRFICAVCSEGFIQNNSLRLHIRVHHPDSVSA